MVAASRLRVVCFGTPAFAVPTLRALIESSHYVVAVVSQPDRPKGRGHQVAATPTTQPSTEPRTPAFETRTVSVIRAGTESTVTFQIPTSTGMAGADAQEITGHK